MKEKWSSFSSSLLHVPSKVEYLLYLSLLWGESFCALKFPGQCQDTQVHLRDHTLCHKPCPALDICNHSLNCKHRASFKEGVLLSLCCLGACRSSCFILWLCVQGWNLPQAWQQVHLHHCPWRVASARSQGCSWQTTCGEKSLLLTRSFTFNKCSFFFPLPPISFFISFLVVSYTTFSMHFYSTWNFTQTLFPVLFSVFISDFWHFEIPECLIFPLWSLFLHLDEGLILNSSCHWFVVSCCTLICWY